MKIYFKYFAIAAIALSGCKKEVTSSVQTPPPIIINVLEKFTNKPIAGATVRLQKCARYDFLFGCLNYETIATQTTGSSGQATFPGNIKAIAVEAEHSHYWKKFTESLTEITLTPKATIKTIVKRKNVYASTDVLTIELSDADCIFTLTNTCSLRQLTMGLPVDTVAFSEALGYTNNQLTWKITTASGFTSHSLPPFYITGFDTATVTFEY